MDNGSFDDKHRREEAINPAETSSKVDTVGGPPPRSPRAPPSIIHAKKQDHPRDRNVSWDMGAPGSLDMEGDGVFLTPDLAANNSDDFASGITYNENANLSVNDVIKHAPIEEEAAAAIQRALEEQDPTKNGSSEAEKMILSGATDDAAHNFDVEESSAPPQNKTAQHLFDLTSELLKIQNLTSSPKFHESGFGTSNQDTFVKNAAMLLKRKSKKDENLEDENTMETEQPQAPFDAKAKWGKIRGVVSASTVAKAVTKSSGDIEEGQAGDDNNGKEKKVANNSYEAFKAEFKDFNEWLKFSRKGVWTYLKIIFFYLIFPSTGVAALLFYVFENPPCGTQAECIKFQNSFRRNATDTEESDGSLRSLIIGRSETASISWWLLFLGARMVITFSLALAAQGYIIDFLALRTRWFVKVFGPFLTLMIVQSKGFPFILFAWGCFNFLLLYGNGKFARHWLYFLDEVDLFNDTNPSGGIPASDTYQTVLILFIVIGSIVAIKRFWVGLYLGRQTFLRYANDLKAIIRKAIIVSQVASLAREAGKYSNQLQSLDILHSTSYRKAVEDEEDNMGTTEEQSYAPQSMRSLKSAASIDFSSSQRTQINELLGVWEEPTIGNEIDQDVHISSIIQFRRSLSTLNNSMPFSVAFGLADTRENCISSAQKVYLKLRSSRPELVCLSFDTLALLAMNPDGRLDKEKLKELIRIFRPDREGNLTLLDFVKSVDAVYKELRTLRASVANSSKIDKAFEGIINILFYFIVACFTLSAIGVDPFVLFASISGFILGFAFMIGAACSKLFEGILFILRRPYDIGDRINLSNPTTDSPSTGSPGWIVKDVTLFTTTVLYASSNEVATYSNGAIAASRVINCNRSPNAALWFTLKFPLEADYRKYSIFHSAIERFVKDRPREWQAFLAFRPVGAAADLGYVEYIVFCTHREPWSNTGACKTSLANLQSFCLELQKKMNMRYISPPMPVHLTMGPKLDPSVLQGIATGSSFAPGTPPRPGPTRKDTDDFSYGSQDVNAVAAMFEAKKP